MALFPVTFCMIPNYPQLPYFRNKSAEQENGWRDRARFWHRGFHRLIIHGVEREFVYKRTSLLNFRANSELKKIRNTTRRSSQVLST